MSRGKLVAAAVGGALLVGTLTACGLGDKVTEPFQDAPRSGSDNGPVEIVTDADGFSNVATKCNHGNRVYVAYHGDAMYAALAVVAHDPTCPQVP